MFAYISLFIFVYALFSKVLSKIRSLNEYYNNIVNCSLPVANTGADIASLLKYFSQTLLEYA
jgi:hypothetical protein